MADEIPITFEHKGKTYKGFFSLVSGAGSTSTFYLRIDHYYCGRLRWYADWFVFDPTPKTESFVELTDYFGMCIMGWYC